VLLAADFGGDVPGWAKNTTCINPPWPRLWHRSVRARAWSAAAPVARPGAFSTNLRLLAERALNVVLFPDEMATWVRGAVAHARREFASDHPDAVLSMAPRFSAHVVGERLARTWGVPWVADFQDPFLGNVFINWPTPLHRALAARLERTWASRAAALITTTESLRGELLGRYPCLEGKVEVVPNGYDEVEPEPVALERDGFHVVHCGQFYGGRVPDYFLRAVADLRERRPDLRKRLQVHFVGPVSDRLQDAAHGLRLGEAVHIEGVVPYARSIGWMRAADLLLLIKHTSPAAGTQVPTKLYEYLGAGKPVLALAHEGEMAEILRRARGGVVVPPADVELISKTLEMFANGHRFHESGPDDSFVRQFALPVLMGQMARVLDSACGASGR